MFCEGGFQSVGNDVVDVAYSSIVLFDADEGVRVEAVAILISVQRAPGGCDIDASEFAVLDDEVILFPLDDQSVAGDLEAPRCFHQPPPGFDFVRQVAELFGFTEPQQGIGQHQILLSSLKVFGVERGLPHGPADVLEGIHHVVEAEFKGDVFQSRFVEVAIAVLTTGLEESTGRRGALLVRVAQVPNQLLSVGQAELIQRHRGLTGFGHIEQRLGKGKLVCGHIEPKQDQRPPPRLISDF